jgi:hypothetical protein
MPVEIETSSSHAAARMTTTGCEVSVEREHAYADSNEPLASKLSGGNSSFQSSTTRASRATNRAMRD